MSSNKKTIVKIFHDGFKQKIDIKKKKETKKQNFNSIHHYTSKII